MSVVLGFIVGVAVGLILGVLLAPTAHLLVGRSEWRRASRELELADRLLENISHAPAPDPSSDEPQSVAHGHRR